MVREIFIKRFSDMEREKENQVQLRALLVQILEEGKEKGEFARNFDACTVADILSGMYFYTLFQ
ncbi:MAG: hypothetical protein H0Z35_08785 [Thermoanaerobacteraceae bacterium]|nr:hypothetical protein [Thermoanaerobacteraceae bacterium]